MSKILVAGGAGFIGSHLCASLLEDGNEVICLDNLYTGSKKNIYDFNDYNNFEFIRHDITIPIYFEIDQIYNPSLSSKPNGHYQNDPVQTIKTNVHGSINLLGLAKEDWGPHTSSKHL